MKTMSVADAAAKWGLTQRSVQLHCEKGNIPGTTIVGKSWRIPADAERPMRKPRAHGQPSSIRAALVSEKRGRVTGGLYHRLQIDFTYSSNHIEGSRLTHEQTRWIFETKTIGDLPSDLPVDNVVETANHFRCVDIVLETAGAALTERYVKNLHRQLKSGTTDSRQEWFAVGDYKRLDNVVGGMETCPAKDVQREMAKLLSWWNSAEKSFVNLLDLHVKFEGIHPFQDGNGRIGRLILLKECLKHGITPFIITDGMRRFYYLGLQEWRKESRLRLVETCRTGQEVFIDALRKTGYAKLAEKALAEQAKSEGKMQEGQP